MISLQYLIFRFRPKPDENLCALSLVYSVKQINKNQNILPNFTLGFHIYHSYFDERIIYKSILSLTAARNRPFPNYNCETTMSLVAVIGGPDSETSLSMTNVLPVYKIPQVWNVCGVQNSYNVFSSLPLFSQKNKWKQKYDSVIQAKQQGCSYHSQILIR